VSAAGKGAVERSASDHALDMAAVCRGAARACRGDGEEAGAAAFDAAAKGHTFRSRELRYDARGGMTEALARRRFEPGARWTTRWTPGEVFTVRRLDRSGLVARVHFDRCFPESLDTLSSGRGWMFLDLGDANGGHVPPGGWP
jgi:hypothetical protein